MLIASLKRADAPPSIEIGRGTSKRRAPRPDHQAVTIAFEIALSTGNKQFVLNIEQSWIRDLVEDLAEKHGIELLEKQIDENPKLPEATDDIEDDFIYDDVPENYPGMRI